MGKAVTHTWVDGFCQACGESFEWWITTQEADHSSHLPATP